MNQISNKASDVQAVIDDTNSHIAALANNKKIVDAKVASYNNLLQRIQDSNNAVQVALQKRNAIPNLLNNIMSAIPRQVQLLSIANTTGKHIRIEAQSADYQSLGYFIARIKSDAILLNVTSTTGVKTSGMVTVTVEGDLPY
ncbi:MAG: hypothetical protein FWC53_01145 [Firmicutes bacterium]|nr:hypothetical protein [Bacillota bacterium]